MIEIFLPCDRGVSGLDVSSVWEDDVSYRNRVPAVLSEMVSSSLHTLLPSSVYRLVFGLLSLEVYVQVSLSLLSEMELHSHSS